MPKTPFEIRMDALKLAYDHQMQKNQREFDVSYNNATFNKTMLTEVPEVPSIEKIISEAEKLKKFIDTP
jgi:hypothetical protein